MLKLRSDDAVLLPRDIPSAFQRFLDLGSLIVHLLELFLEEIDAPLKRSREMVLASTFKFFQSVLELGLCSLLTLSPYSRRTLSLAFRTCVWYPASRTASCEMAKALRSSGLKTMAALRPSSYRSATISELVMVKSSDETAGILLTSLGGVMTDKGCTATSKKES